MIASLHFLVVHRKKAEGTWHMVLLFRHPPLLLFYCVMILFFGTARNQWGGRYIRLFSRQT